MNPSSPRHSLVIRYILGELTENEQTQVEEKYFADEEFLQEVRAARDDLVDAYVRGKLSEADRLRFEKRMNEVPSLRAKVEFAEVLARGLMRGR